MTAPPKSKNIQWQQSRVSRERREQLHGHRGMTLWLTGLSGAGKSTLALSVELGLAERRCFAYVLDGDNLRHGLNKDLGFAPEDRTENIRRVGEVARLFTDAGAVCLSAFISPYRADRRQIRDSMAEGDFAEIYVCASLDVCEARDPKGLYQKARAGLITNFTGIDAPYEPPEAAELVIDTERESVGESTSRVLAFLEARGVIPSAL